MSSKTIRSVKSQQPKEDLSIVKVLRFMGWTSAIIVLAICVLVLFQAIFFQDGDILTRIEAEISINKLAIALIMATVSGVTFGTASQIRENPAAKKTAITSLIVSAVLISICAILGVSFAQPIPW